VARGEAGVRAGRQAEARGLVPEAAGAGQWQGMLDCVKLKHSKNLVKMGSYFAAQGQTR
jgi:hypothetical protein